MLKPCQKKDPLRSRTAFRNALVRWFEANARDYPWRRTEDPYRILISEVMLQQTQIATVLGRGHYRRFLDAFPDIGSLAAADDARLLKAWEGLGYYRRARMLRDTARAVVERHGGEFPDRLDALLELPGIGRYTAGALRAFAHGLPAVLVDGNVSRVLARLLDDERPIDDAAGGRRLWQWAAELADDQRPREYHAALMELGQQVCRPRQPDCLQCPVAGFCAARKPEALPVKRGRTKVTAVDEHALWLRDGDGRVLMQREHGSRRTGLWKLPVRDAALVDGMPVLAEQTYGITRFRVTLRVHDGGPIAAAIGLQDGEQWVNEEDIDGLAMAAPFRKVLERLLRDG